MRKKSLVDRHAVIMGVDGILAHLEAYAFFLAAVVVDINETDPVIELEIEIIVGIAFHIDDLVGSDLPVQIRDRYQGTCLDIDHIVENPRTMTQDHCGLVVVVVQSRTPGYQKSFVQVSLQGGSAHIVMFAPGRIKVRPQIGDFFVQPSQVTDAVHRNAGRTGGLTGEFQIGSRKIANGAIDAHFVPGGAVFGN
ncbi:hypothetical protein SDC9_147092 [bioreactor metagenome]|uniref:Uncharacterized protein n=1 Tax=bioreactor metagenome TaxID=1076179 RepID=A0A645ED48_9ZZZZ